MNQPPLVDVVIPAYNAEATLRETVASLQRQTLGSETGGWRATIVNDGSTDRTGELAERLAAEDPRVRVVHQPNGSAAAARNTGLDLAEAIYIHFLDSDDLLSPHALETLVGCAEQSGLGAACGSVAVCDAQGRPLGGERLEPAQAVVGLDEMLDGNPLCSHAQVIRRDLIGPERFDTTLRNVEDFDLWLRLAHRGLRWRTVARISERGEDCVALYRMAPSSKSKNARGMAESFRRVFSRAYARETGPDTPDADRSPVRLRSAVRRHALMYATIAALCDPSDGLDAGADIAAGSLDGRPITPDEAAEIGAWAVVFGLCRLPGSADDGLDWLPTLRAWWDRCECSALSGPGLAQRAEGALPGYTVTADRTAAAALEVCDQRWPGVRRVHIVGMGRNGRRIAASALRRGVGIVARDDRFDNGTLRPEEICPSIEVVRMAAPVAMDEPVIVTPLHDGPLVERLPELGGAVRWSRVRAQLATDFASRLASNVLRESLRGVA